MLSLQPIYALPTFTYRAPCLTKTYISNEQNLRQIRENYKKKNVEKSTNPHTNRLEISFWACKTQINIEIWSMRMVSVSLSPHKMTRRYERLQIFFIQSIGRANQRNSFRFFFFRSWIQISPSMGCI